MPKVYLASDHTGVELKAHLIAYLGELGYEAEDLGAARVDAGDDYPDLIRPCAERVAGEPGARGVVIGGSGQGEAMVANRVEGARAAVYYGPAERSQTDADGATLDIITSVRAHNDANILSLGARFISPDEAARVVKQFLEVPFSGETRHARRIAKF